MSKRRKQHIKAARAAQKAAIVTTPGLDDATDSNSATDFKLVIPEEIHKKVMYWIDKASPNEVSGFGTLFFNKETRVFTVTDAYLLDQEVSGGSAEMDQNAINKALYQKRNQTNALKWHWHSHPTFGVFWSGTDLNLIRQLGQQGWIVATVLNCKRECRTAFLTTVDVMGKPHDIFVDNFATEVRMVANEKAKALYDAEYAAKVKVKTWKHHNYPAIPKHHSTHDPYEMWEKSKKHSRALVNDDKPERGSLYTPILPPGSALPVPQFIPDSKYDRFGFATVEGVEIYNPLKDADIIAADSDDLLFAMIADMSEQEIKFLEKCDAKFSNAVRRYVTSLAKSEVFWEGSDI